MTWNDFEHIALVAIVANTCVQIVWFWRTKDKH